MATNIGLPPGFILDEPRKQPVAPQAPNQQTQMLPAGFALEEPTAITQQQAIAPVQEQPSTIEALGRGYLKGGQDVITGLLQTGADILGRAAPESEKIQAFRELLGDVQQRRERQFEAQLGDSTAAQIGEFVGEVAPAVAALPAGGPTLAGRMAAGALGGAVVAGTAPTPEVTTPEEALEQRGREAATFGAVGAAIPGIGPAIGVARRTMSKVLGIDTAAVREMAEAGISPTMAAVSGQSSKIIEKSLSELPIAASIIKNASQRVVSQVSDKVTRQAEKLSTAATREEAGRAIQKGAKTFVRRFKDRADVLYSKVDDFVKPDDAVPVTKTLDFLKKQTQEFAETPNIENVMSNPKLSRMSEALIGDATDGTIPYKILTKLRSKIGGELSNPVTLADIPRAELKQLYSSISDDIKELAISKGPKAIKAFNQANNYYKGGADRIKTHIDDLIKAKTPERAFQLATQGTKEGATKLRALRKSIPKEKFDALRGVVLRRMGQATPAAQDAAGQAFSVNTFMTNWNRLDNNAKNALFAGSADKVLSNSLNKLARATSRLKEVERLANTSGTARQITNFLTGASFLANPILTTTGLAAGATGAKLMTSPKFVNWLSGAVVQKTPRAAQQHIQKLEAIAVANPDIREEILEYLSVF